jgi:hypothetical protein
MFITLAWSKLAKAVQLCFGWKEHDIIIISTLPLAIVMTIIIVTILERVFIKKDKFVGDDLIESRPNDEKQNLPKKRKYNKKT